MLIDAHSHLDVYGSGLQPALEEITEHRIRTISNSMDLPSYQRNVEIAKRCELVVSIFGVHPWKAPEYAHRLSELRQPVEQSPMLGEIGLDQHFVRDRSQYDAQREVLEYFLVAASDQDKIVSVHTKGAEDEILQLLDQHAIRRAIVHWYSGPLDTLRELVDRGYYFTVGVEILRTEHIRTIAKTLPSDRILTETDNPGGWRWLTGRHGMPRLVLEMVRALAKLRGMTPEALSHLVSVNFLRLIEADPWCSGLKESLSLEA